MKLAVRYFFSTLLVIVFCFSFAKTPAFAQNQVQPQAQPVNSYAAPNTSPDVPNNLHNWTQNVVIDVVSAMICQLAGVDPTNPSTKCLGVDQKSGKIGFVQNGSGALGIMGNLIASTLNPPIHTHDYLAYLSNNFGLAKPTYAASQTGFNSLSPMMGIWVTFRNIAYLLFVLVFIIIGIAIMLRVKIDPRTVMTIQNQIPKIIIGLILVTFSFAIAGLLIDIMWIVVYLFINILIPADPKIGDIAGTTGMITSQLNTTPFDFINKLFNGGLPGIAVNGGVSIGSVINNMLSGGQAVGGSGSSVVDLITNPIGTILGAIMHWLIVFIGGIVAFLIIVIALLYSMFKLWFALLEAYIMVLVDVIFAPFWIISGLLPGGQTMGFGAWLKDMLGNLSAFPTTIMMFLLGKILIDAFGTNYVAGQFNPPLIGTPGSGDTNTFGALIAIAIIFTTPHVVKITKAVFKAPKIDLGPIGQAVGAGSAVPGRLASGGMNIAFGTHYETKDGVSQMVQKGGPIGRFVRSVGGAH